MKLTGAIALTAALPLSQIWSCYGAQLFEEHKRDELSVAIFCKAIIIYLSDKQESSNLPYRRSFEDSSHFVGDASDQTLNHRSDRWTRLEVQISKKVFQLDNEAFAEVVASWSDCVGYYRDRDEAE